LRRRFDQRLFAHGGDIVAAHQNLTVGGVHQAVEQADEGGFAGAGQAHQDKYFAFIDVEIGVLHADHHAGLLEYFVLAEPALEHLHGQIGAMTEYFVEILDDDFFSHWCCPRLCWA